MHHAPQTAAKRTTAAAGVPVYHSTRPKSAANKSHDAANHVKIIKIYNPFIFRLYHLQLRH